jgi:hypothetical protein
MTSRALDVVKMKSLVPCEVENPHKTYKCRIVEVVYDPLRVEEVNERFKTAGYDVTDGTQVIAVNEDGSILIWGGLNSVYHLQKGEQIGGAFDLKHLAFGDILDLTGPFKIKNKKGEIDELIAQLSAKYGE